MNDHQNQKSPRRKAKERQLRYLSQSARLEETLHPRLVYATITGITLAVVVFIAWSAMTDIREVARVPGEVVPRGFQQVVQHFDGGLVRSINVAEGAMVEEGDILLQIESAGAIEDLSRSSKQQTVLHLQRERLRAYLDGRKPDFTDVDGATPELVSEQQEIFNAMIESQKSERAILADQITQKKHAIQVLEARRGTAAKNVNLMQDMYNRRSDLHKKGYVSQLSYLQTQRELNAGRGELNSISGETDVARASLQEYEMRLASLAAAKRDEAFKALEQVDLQISQNEEIIKKSSSRMDRQVVRAPVRGYVKGVSVNTIGAVVSPGQALMEIVPMDENLVVEVRISPRHIGPLKAGQPVLVKISSYDFSRYGAVGGVLEYISATTFVGDNGERFYRGRVKLESNHVGHGQIAEPLLPGMTVMADIVTGSKTILDYLLKPVHRAMLSAFSER